MKWIRRRDENDNTYYVEERGRFLIDKKITDDRDFDGGYFNVEWTLHEYNPAYHNGYDYTSGYAPVDSYGTLAQAKAAV